MTTEAPGGAMAAKSARPLDASDLVLVMDGRLTPARAAEGDFFIGRDVPSADIHLDHPAISRLHARLEPGTRWRIIDFESRNGIYIDGRRVREATITDGMSVAFGAPEGPTVIFRYGTDALDNLGRLGRAVARRIADLGLSRRDVRLQANIDASTMDDLLNGRYWPDSAIRRAIDNALAWPPGSLAAICDGAAPEDVTDVITPAVRHSLLLDSAALRLESIAADLVDLPAATDPGYQAQASLLQRQIQQFDSSLSAHAHNARSEFAQLLQRIAQIYGRRLPAPDVEIPAPAMGNTSPAPPQAPLRSQEHEA
ncbi:FHA domain-containing protein [Mycobacterium sp. URHD0025]|uniref:FHA domain-containing protein n=1 Tax=Mycobacterium sp. URHD0025 TaxID=1298864 RepID=UPI0012DD1BFD|nr:FHA domain-containing protein [Mycobacterium sp. URHD0025]